MIQARELRIDSDTTVTDLFNLMDMPYKIIRKAKVALIPDPTVERRYETMATLILRIEWEVEKGDPEV